MAVPEAVEYSPKGIEIVRAATSSRRLLGLLDSLRMSQITRVRWKGRSSRTGLTYFVRSVEVETETGKYNHSLSCFAMDDGLYCDWEVNGEHVGVIKIDYTNDLADDILDAIDVALRMERTEENEVRLDSRPDVVWEPTVVWR